MQTCSLLAQLFPETSTLHVFYRQYSSSNAIANFRPLFGHPFNSVHSRTKLSHFAHAERLCRWLFIFFDYQTSIVLPTFYPGVFRNCCGVSVFSCFRKKLKTLRCFLCVFQSIFRRQPLILSLVLLKHPEVNFPWLTTLILLCRTPRRKYFLDFWLPPTLFRLPISTLTHGCKETSRVVSLIQAHFLNTVVTWTISIPFVVSVVGF